MLVLGALVLTVVSSSPATVSLDVPGLRSADGDAAAPDAQGAPVATTTYPLRRYCWIPAAAGSVALAVGGSMYFSSANARRHFAAGATPPGSIEAFIDRNVALERGGLVLAGLGVAGLTAGAVMFLLPESSRPTVAAAASADGFAVTFTGRLP